MSELPRGTEADQRPHTSFLTFLMIYRKTGLGKVILHHYTEVSFIEHCWYHLHEVKQWKQSNSCFQNKHWLGNKQKLTFKWVFPNYFLPFSPCNGLYFCQQQYIQRCFLCIDPLLLLVQLQCPMLSALCHMNTDYPMHAYKKDRWRPLCVYSVDV